jgi:hypothetical protein
LNESKYYYWLTLEDGKTIQFSELADLIAQALHPSDTEIMDYACARINLDDELRLLVRNGELQVRNPYGLGKHTLPFGDALNRSVLLQQDLLPLLESKGIGIRVTADNTTNENRIPAQIKNNKASKKNKMTWDNEALKKLYRESIEIGITHQDIADRYGVSRPFISKYIKKAEDENKPKKATPFDAVTKIHRK